MEVFANPRTPSKVTRYGGILVAARIIWAAVFSLLLLYAALRLVSGGSVQGVAGEWLVNEGLPAASTYVSTDTFFTYLVVLRFAVLAVFGWSPY